MVDARNGIFLQFLDARSQRLFFGWFVVFVIIFVTGGTVRIRKNLDLFSFPPGGQTDGPFVQSLVLATAVGADAAHASSALSWLLVNLAFHFVQAPFSLRQVRDHRRTLFRSDEVANVVRFKGRHRIVVGMSHVR